MGPIQCRVRKVAKLLCLQREHKHKHAFVHLLTSATSTFLRPVNSASYVPATRSRARVFAHKGVSMVLSLFPYNPQFLGLVPISYPRVPHFPVSSLDARACLLFFLFFFCTRRGVLAPMTGGHLPSHR